MFLRQEYYGRQLGHTHRYCMSQSQGIMYVSMHMYTVPVCTLLCAVAHYYTHVHTLFAIRISLLSMLYDTLLDYIHTYVHLSSIPQTLLNTVLGVLFTYECTYMQCLKRMYNHCPLLVDET